MSQPVNAAALQKVAADLRGYAVSDERAAQIAQEVARVNNAARAEGARNEFNAQPTDFAVTLSRLSVRAVRTKQAAK
jgi:hypothetical protein